MLLHPRTPSRSSSRTGCQLSSPAPYSQFPVTVIEPAATSFRDWAVAHSAGALPDLSPYGLHRLQASYALTTLRLPPQRLHDALRLTLPSRPPSAGAPLALAWDERAAVRATARLRKHSVISGVIWLTDSWPAMSAAERTVYRRALSRMKLLWVLSAAQIEPLRRIVSGKTPIHLLRFGIDVEFFRRTALPEHPSLLSIGNDKDRDLRTLFAALELVHNALPDVPLRVQTASTLRPPAGVEILPSVPHRQLLGLYDASTVVALATRPNLHVSGMTTTLEAGSVGRPVVLSRTPSAEEYVSHGGTGILVPPGDARALADACIRLLRDRQLAARMGHEAANQIRLHHTSQQMVEDLARIIGEVTS